ncbi:MAG: sigma 54-interacting transcriptional regulator [Bacteroidota bacterium]
MDKKILIVEDEFVVANDLQIILKKAGYHVCGIADSFDEALAMAEEKKPGIVLLDIYLKGTKTGIDLAKILTEKNIGFVYLSANSNQPILEAARATQPYGFMVKPFREKDVLVTVDIAYYRHAHSLETKLHKEQSLQLSLNNILADDTGWDERLLKVAMILQPAVPFDFVMLGLKKLEDDPPRACTFFRIGFNEYQSIRIPEFMEIAGVTTQQFNELGKLIVADGPKIYNAEEFTELCRRIPIKQRLAKKYQLESNLVMPLHMSDEGIFLFSFYSRRPDIYNSEHLLLLKRLQPSIAMTINRLLAFDEIKKLTEQLKREKTYLQEEVKTSANFEEIVGSSHKMLHVFDMISQVAQLDTSVLLLGESGTGKELVARAIHNLSPRKGKILIKVNCAALPANLIESELFGHEKGAFTGAIDRRIGKFELANGSTIFLDEVGEMPLDLQVKLLRVLQEKEIERVGGKQTIKIDVRIIAATNRDLEKEIAHARFRLDLYYRLNVFPIVLPSLKERKEDIPMLAHHFAHKFSKKTGKPFHGIDPAAMQELINYNWPGNIREMENIIEQAFVLNDGKSQLQWGRPLANTASEKQTSASFDHPQTLTDVKELQQATERDYILSVLKKTNGKIRGAGGAAEILNLKPTTLESRMEKLGIKKTFYRQ